jgi:1-aminocyclopropane-1-carboxylate synthase
MKTTTTTTATTTANRSNSYQSIRISQNDDTHDDDERIIIITSHQRWSSYCLLSISLVLIVLACSKFMGTSTNTKEESSSTTVDVDVVLSHASPHPMHHNPSTHHDDTFITKGPHHLSSRAIIPLVRDDIHVFMDAKANEYHPITNPKGKLILLVAENRLLYPELSQQLHSVTIQNTSTIPEWVFDYDDFHGHTTFRQALAHMMEDSWMKQGIPVRPDALVIGSGAGAILDVLSWTLAEANESVLVNGPMYAAFPGDFGIHGHLHMELIPTFPSTNYEPTRHDLEQAYHASQKKGHTPRILLICQPHNPTGAVYSQQSMQTMIDWALEHELHVVSDEIYGNSVFPGVHVTSAAEIMWQRNQDTNNATHHNNNDNYYYLGDRVHIVAGLSKDWGASGLRVGTLLTHNTALYDAMGMLSYYNGVSQLTQWAFTQLLNDREWRDWYLAENQKRLYEVFLATKQALALIDVSVYEGTQGTLFAWADFSAYLRPNQTERELWMELYHEANVLLTLGESFHGEKPGMFRIVYTWPHGGVEAMNEMGRRLVQWKQKNRA